MYWDEAKTNQSVSLAYCSYYSCMLHTQAMPLYFQ